MAIESVGYTEGSGKEIAVDTIGGVEYQVVKIMTGADGSATSLLILGQSTKSGSLPVTLASDEDNVTVDGTVTANLSATDNAVLDNIDTQTAAIQTAVELIDNAISGSEMQVDVVASLPAGTNNIGDVDVASVPGALQGPGNPSIDSYSSVAVDLAASTANQQLVAAPGASKQIWVYGFFAMADTAAGTLTLQDEDDTALSGTMAVSDEGGWVLPMSGNFAMPWVKVATNKALEADTGACTVDGILTYAIVSV